MRRSHLVLGGTVAGIAGVLAFPTHGTHLSIPAAGASGTSASTTSNTPSTTAPANGGTPATAAPAATTRSATSAVQSFRYGDMSVKVTVDGSKITNLAIASIDETDGRSVSIDRYAVPQLEQQVLSANSVNIDGVSGATFTSQAFVDAVSNALSKLGIQS
jgi:uncharacterized protein with FMN-binding domain